MNYSISWSVLFCFFAFTALAQDPLLSIETTVPFYMNPANAGNPYFTQVNVNYRNHLPTTGNSYITYSASFDTYVESINSGFGVMLMSDQLGSKSFTYNTAQLVYAHQIQVNENAILRGGLSSNLYFASRNPNDLNFIDMIGPDGTQYPSSYTYDKVSAFGVDFGAGAVYETRMLKLGFATHHLGSPKDSLYWHRRLKWNLQAELRIPLYGKTSYVPLSEMKKILRKTEIRPMVYVIGQGNHYLIGTGSNLQISNYVVGLFARTANSASASLFTANIFSIQLGYLSESLEINYRMDIGALGKTYVGMPTSSHEIGITIKFPGNKEESW